MSMVFIHRAPYFLYTQEKSLMRMNKDGLFKIMQITDMQEIPKVSPDTMALLEAAIEDEKPDLVVYTGDLQGKRERS